MSEEYYRYIDKWGVCTIGFPAVSKADAKQRLKEMTKDPKDWVLEAIE